MTGEFTAAIFTALALETEAVVAHLDGVTVERSGESIYQRGTFSSGLRWRVYVVETGPENQVAATAVESALQTLHPAAAIFVGVAGGFAEKGVELLDLVVPPSVEYYQAGKAGDAFTPRHRPKGPSRYFLEAARQIARDGTWTSRAADANAADTTVWFDPLGDVPTYVVNG
jgi:nucleoside phosphorylase